MENTIKVSGKGTASCEIMGTEIEDQDIDIPRMKELDKKIEEMEVEKKRISGSLALLGQQEELLNSIMTNSTTQTGKEIAAGKPDIIALDKFFAFLTAKFEAIKSGRFELEMKQAGLAKELDKINKEYATLLSNKARKGKKVSVLMRCDRPGNLAVSLYYTVKGCSWSPAYIAKAIPESSQMEITTMASIVQRTYEDWNDAVVTLSTATPAMGVLPPDLNPTFLDYYVPQPERRVSKKSEMSGGVEGGVLGGVYMAPTAVSSPLADSAIENSYTMEEVASANYSNAALSEAGIHLNFSIRGRIDVASDGKPHKFFISKDTVDAKYDYYGVPRQDDKAFMRGIFTNKMDYPILPGEVEFFYAGELVGSAYLPAVARGQEAEAYFGRNSEISNKFEELKREKMEQGFLGNKERIKFQNKITIENHTKNEIRIEVLDKIPKPQRVEIELVDVRIAPDKTSEKPNSILSWILDLKPQEKKEILVDFTIEYPKGVILRGI